MNYQFLETVKAEIETSPKCNGYKVDVYIEPSISSILFCITVDSYKHIFKAPFGLLETNITAMVLAKIIIDEVKEWRDKLNED